MLRHPTRIVAQPMDEVLTAPRVHPEVEEFRVGVALLEVADP